MTEALKLSRSDSKPWGFRLSGGKDFGIILTVGKVNPGSIAAEKGLQTGDVVAAINGQDTSSLRHKEAQDAILRAGNELEIIIQRGANSWKPAIRKDKNATNDVSASGDKVTAILHQQYNSPVAVYSMNSIAETLSAHAEMIAPGVMGINFMKPEHPVNTMSEVYRLVQEEEQNKAKSPTPPRGSTSPSINAPRRAAPPIKTPPAVPPKPTANVTNSVIPQKPAPVPPPNSQGTCTDCGRFITGTFVQLNDRLLHDDCFKCSTCGTSLKNIAFVNINNKLYCDTHAKLAAKVIAPEKEILPMNVEMPRNIPEPTLPSQNIVPPPMQNIVPPSMQNTVSAPLSQVSSMPQGPTPFVPHSMQNLGNLPQSPSSSGGLAFRSISPQPFKRSSGDFHRVTAPMSPTTATAGPPSFLQNSSPLPFETKPYIPQDQDYSLSSSLSSSQISQVSQTTTQISSTEVSQQSSHFQVDYKQIVGQQKTKFVWPPPKPEEMMREKSLDQTSSAASFSTQQTYSSLATQSTPPQAPSQTTSVPFSVPSQPSLPSQPSFPSQPTFPSQPSFPSQPTAPKSQAPPTFVPPPLPTTFPKAPDADKEMKANTAGFAPVLPPVVDNETKNLGGVPQTGVPTGAGSRPAPKRGKGQLKEQTPGCRIPICSDCGAPIRGPFIIALSKTWCPDHFHCNNLHCKRPLQDTGFVEEQGQLYCENCYEAFLAPICNKCGARIKGDCLNALDKQWHPECFLCAYCHKPFGNSSFYIEDGLPYCEKDWNELFTTKCVGCGFAIEAGDRWVEALNNNYHSQCFKCTICSKNLEGQSFYAKGGKPFCKTHAR